MNIPIRQHVGRMREVDEDGRDQAAAYQNYCFSDHVSVPGLEWVDYDIIVDYSATSCQVIEELFNDKEINQLY